VRADRVADSTGGPLVAGDPDLVVQSPLHDAAEVRQRAGTATAKGNKTVRLDAALALRLAEAYVSLRVEHDRFSAESADALWALEAPPPTPGPTREPWTFDVNYEGGSYQVDYGTGTEWDGSYQWAIYDGPHEIDDVVLAGAADEDPMPVLTALVAEHNRAAADGAPDEPASRTRVTADGRVVPTRDGAPDEPTDDDQESTDA
jgi:hypothetical protein